VSFIDPDFRQQLAADTRERQAKDRAGDATTGDYRTFALTEADVGLLDAVARLNGTHGPWRYPRDPVSPSDGQVASLFGAVWLVLGERHGFNPSSAAPHPDGGARVLAKAAVRMR
jgi:hypothetical protein